MKKKIISLSWLKIRPSILYVVAVLFIGLYIFKSVDFNKASVNHESDTKNYKAQIEILKDYSEDNVQKIEVLTAELYDANVELDSMSSIVDNIVPDIIHTVEYVVNPENYDDPEYESSKENLIVGIKTMIIERQVLIKAVEARDVIIYAQAIQIENLNKQIKLMNESSKSMLLSNLALKKQVRKEVRKRRLTTVVSVAAVVGIIIITK